MDAQAFIGSSTVPAPSHSSRNHNASTRVPWNASASTFSTHRVLHMQQRSGDQRDPKERPRQPRYDQQRQQQPQPQQKQFDPRRRSERPQNSESPTGYRSGLSDDERGGTTSNAHLVNGYVSGDTYYQTTDELDTQYDSDPYGSANEESAYESSEGAYMSSADKPRGSTRSSMTGTSKDNGKYPTGPSKPSRQNYYSPSSSRESGSDREDREDRDSSYDPYDAGPEPEAILHIRNLKKIPVFEDRFDPWLLEVNQVLKSRGFDYDAASKLLKCLNAFQRKSDVHRNAMTNFVRSTNFFNEWRGRAIPFLPNGNCVSWSLSLQSIVFLNLRPGKDFLDAWFAATGDLSRFDASALSTSIWSLAKLRWRPTKAWMNDFYRAFVRERSKMGAQSLGYILWSIAVLDVNSPPQSFYDAFDEVFESKVEQLDPQTLANCAWAYGKLGEKPSVEFLKAWYSGFRNGYKSFSSNALANTLWGFAKLDIMPSDAFMSKWYESFALKRGSFSGQDLSSVLWAMGRLRLDPSEDFLQIWVEEFTNKMSSTEGTNLAQVIWSLARLGIRPRQAFIDSWNEYFLKAQCMSYDNGTWSNALWGQAKLMIVPADEFLDKFYVVFPKFRGQQTWPQLCQILWSFGKLNMMPKEEFLFHWEDDFLPLIERVDGQGLSNVLWSFGRFKIMPSGRFLRAWMEAFEKSVSRYMGQECANILWAWNRLDIFPGEAALEKWYSQYKLAWQNRNRYPFYPVSPFSLRRFGMDVLADDEDEGAEEMQAGK